MDNRNDDLTALLIDAIVTIGKERGTTELACILCGNGVPLEVAVRVLTKPAYRRDVTYRLKQSDHGSDRGGKSEAQRAEGAANTVGWAGK